MNNPTQATAPATAQHTSTPWEIGHQLGDGFSIAHEIAPNCGLLVCLATAHNIGGQPFHGFPLDDATAKANRDFIIRAVNSHADLLAALKTVLSEADFGDPALLAQCQAAISKAEGRA